MLNHALARERNGAPGSLQLRVSVVVAVTQGTAGNVEGIAEPHVGPQAQGREDEVVADRGAGRGPIGAPVDLHEAVRGVRNLPEPVHVIHKGVVNEEAWVVRRSRHTGHDSTHAIVSEGVRPVEGGVSMQAAKQREGPR